MAADGCCEVCGEFLDDRGNCPFDCPVDPQPDEEPDA